jgi:hypothetical protein
VASALAEQMNACNGPDAGYAATRPRLDGNVYAWTSGNENRNRRSEEFVVEYFEAKN